MKRMRIVLAAVIGGLAGALVGAGAFWFLVGPNSGESQSFGPWSTSTGIGEAAQSPYVRARTALFGIWGLPPSEVIYFTAAKDSSGETLRRRCTYSVLGGPLPTRWWSVTLYRDGFFIDNPANRYSWSATDITKDAMGRWTIILAPSGEGPNRLTFGSKDGLLQLSLRLYQPNASMADHRERVPVPAIRRMGCVA